MTAPQFLRLLDGGGTIVPSNACSDVEIATARACGRCFVDERGFGAVYRPNRAVSTARQHVADPHDDHLVSLMDWERG